MEGTKKTNLEFSYIQVAIIIVGLGLVVRSIVPSFTQASEQDKVSILADGLSSVRAHLDFYRASNDGAYPPTDSPTSFELAITTEAGMYKPYIESMPVNPFNGMSTTRFDGEAAGTNKAGWRLDTKTGQFKADNNEAYVSL